MEQKVVAIRDAYGAALKNLGGQNEKVVVLEADVGSSSKSILFGQAYPERYFNVGIAELNMVAMAAGFAKSGLIPFVNCFAVFMTTRAADPLNSLIAYDNLNVKVAATYCGLSPAYDGASHHANSDLAFIRSVPNFTVISVCDAVETEKAVQAAAKLSGPVYLRLSRAGAPVIFDESYNFQVGKGVLLKEGKDVTLIATGALVQQSLAAAELLAAEGIFAEVLDIHTIKPIDQELILASARKTGAVVTAEEHSIYGGLGSAVAEVLVEHDPLPLERVGMSGYAESGPYEDLLHKYELDAPAIAAKAKKVLARKK